MHNITRMDSAGPAEGRPPNRRRQPEGRRKTETAPSTGETQPRSLREQLIQGKIDRREFLSRSLMAGLGLAGVGVAGCVGDEVEPSLRPTFYKWIEDLHPGIPRVNARFPGIDYQIAPVEGFGIERFVAEARKGRSTWDVYVGQTPFVEMTAMIEAGVIEPWDGYIPQEVIDDIIPAIREECSVDGKLYSWPFLLDVIGMGWHSGITARAGITGPPPGIWEQYLEKAHAVVDSRAAHFGATFDAHGWRSLAPFAHSMTTDVYTPDGLFDFTHDAAVESLVLMKKIMAVSHPDVLLAGTSDGGVNNTPDEEAFGAQRVGYYTKYFNAALRFAQKWDDPDQVALAPLPKFPGGEGSTVFWTTGCALLRHGGNKEKAAEYIRSLTYDRQLWRDSLAGTETGRPGQLPPYRSIYSEWNAKPPDWLPGFVALVRGQLDRARAIRTHLFGLQQFFIGQPLWETYLKGEEADPRTALANAAAAVRAEVGRG